ncbi:MAG: Zn-finger nucleic acid-binding protein [Cognaticolwellia sp.]|jgi:Zn-finger nucleic acid-binding protein
MRNCPVSGAEMDQVELHGITIDVSPAGMWLDKKELYLLTEAERRDQSGFGWSDLFRKPVAPSVDRERVLQCPVDGQDMDIIDYKGVHIDASTNGVWLDVGEYAAIVNNLRLDPSYVRGIALRLSDAKL